MKATPMFVCLGLILQAPGLAAANLCVTNGAELAAALQTAAGNSQADHIRLARGVYQSPATFNFQPPASEDHDIEISGGWTSSPLGGPCARQAPTRTMFDTLITSDAGGRLMGIVPPAGSSMNVTIRRLAFAAGGGVSGFGIGMGLWIRPLDGYGGTITVERTAFVSNFGANGSGLYVRSGGPIYLRNSVFEGNGTTGRSAVYIDVLDGGSAYVTNNTVVDNGGITTIPPGSGLSVRATAGRVLVANNHAWGNEGNDLEYDVRSGSILVFRNNNAGTLLSFADPASSVLASGNLSQASGYLPGTNYIPAPDSPLIDGGIAPPLNLPAPVPWEHDWTTGSADFLNVLRIQGPGVDIGAYEATPVGLFADGFE